MLFETPAKHLGVFDRKASIEQGKDADLVMTDMNFNVKHVFSNGVIVTD